MRCTHPAARALALLALLSLVPLAGCGGDDDPTGPTGGTLDPLHGTIAFTLDGASVTYDQDAAGTTAGTTLIIAGGDAGGTDGIVLSFPDAEGTYACDDTGAATITVNTDTDVAMTGAAATGTITVTHVGTDEVRGTFSGTLAQVLGSGTVVITNGSFDVPVVR